MSIHKGHRKRIRERFLNADLTTFEDHEVLELLLFYCIPRCDTNEIAHRLVDRFGNFAQVLDAPVSALQQVEGIGENAAVFLSLIRAVSGYYQQKRVDRKMALTTISDYGNFLVPQFSTQRTEEVYLLCLDAKRAPLACRIISEGSVNTAEVSVRKAVEAALAVNATTVILAHNHPSGIALPSMEDIVTTRRLGMALDAVGIILEDHIVVAGRDYVSLRDSGYYDPQECRMLV